VDEKSRRECDALFIYSVLFKKTKGEKTKMMSHTRFHYYYTKIGHIFIVHTHINAPEREKRKHSKAKRDGQLWDRISISRIEQFSPFTNGKRD
jgi:hypothetical protein